MAILQSGGRSDGPVTIGGFERLPDGQRSELPDARRADRARLQRQIQLASESPIVTAVLEASDAVLLVLNPERQIVAFNSRVPGVGARDVRGLRPGEAFGCVNAAGPGGCGAAPACATCGALAAVLACQRRGRPVEAGCSLRTAGQAGATYDFNARAVTVGVEECTFVVLSLRDVSAEKRRQVLEQVFFHDVLNTVAGLRNWAAVLQRAPDPRRAAERIEALSRQIEREIRHQRTVTEAESGTFQPEWAPVRAGEVLEDLAAVFADHPAAAGRRVELAPPAADVTVTSDRALLVRTLVNAVANGLEASPPGEAVRVAASPAEDGGVRFDVHNPGVMAPEVQARVFQRSFSTKAARGRGLGTYSMKLLGERCLGGAVSFTSTSERGTVFTVRLPRTPRGA